MRCDVMRGREGPVVSGRGPRQTSEAEADWRAEVDDDDEAHRGCVWRKMLRDQQHGCSSRRTDGMASRLGRWSNTANARSRATTPPQKKWARSRAPMLRSIRTAASKHQQQQQQQHLLSRLLAPAAPWTLLFAETRTSTQSKSARAHLLSLHPPTHKIT